MESQEQVHNGMVHKETFPGPVTLLRQAYSLYRAQYKIIAPVLAVSFLAGCFQIILTFTSKASPVSYIVGTLLAFILIYLSYLSIVIATVYPTPENIVTSNLYQRAWYVFYSYILVFVLMGIFILAGIILAVIPGIIIAVFLSLSTYVLIAEHQYGMNALTKSWFYVQGNWWKVFGRIIVFVLGLAFVLAFVSAVVFFLGLNHLGPRTIIGMGSEAHEVSVIASCVNQAVQSFFITPFSICFFYLLYSALKRHKSEEQHPLSKKKVRRILYSVVTLCIILAIIVIVLAGALLIKIFNTIQLQQFQQQHGTTTETFLS